VSLDTGPQDTGPLDTGPRDTGPLDTVERGADGLSSRPVTTPRDAWRKARFPVLAGAFVIAAAVLTTVLTGTVSANRLDPEAAGPDGGRALAEILRAHGVDVRKVEVPSGSADATVFVPTPRLVNATHPELLSSLAAAPEVVVAEATGPHLTALGVDVREAGEEGEHAVDPACDQPDAVAAGAVRLGGVVYRGGAGSVQCYALAGRAAFVETRNDGRRVTLLGSGTFMTNKRLGDDGNAALAMRLLMRHPVVEWVYPNTAPVPAGEQQSLSDLLPRRLLVAVSELFVAVLLLALWRGRRLGPVVVEPLPVVVRAAETVEGRARLYEAAGARDQAANALRAGLRDRLVRALGLAPDAGRETLVAAVTSRTSRDGTAVDDLLYGPPPADDAALVRLADGLDSLDSEVRAQ
jgi:hypothetical protein